MKNEISSIQSRLVKKNQYTPEGLDWNIDMRNSPTLEALSTKCGNEKYYLLYHAQHEDVKYESRHKNKK